MNRTYHQILDSAAGLYIPEDLDLSSRVMARLSQRKSFVQTLRARPALAILLAILALLLLTGVAFAISRLTGYIRGVGFVEEGAPIRVLGGIASAQREETTLTMKELIADSAQTLVIYQIQGVPYVQGAANLECIEAPSLLLENGVRLESLSGYKSGWGFGYWMSFDAHFIFPPLPADAQKITLLAPCQLPALRLSLVPAPQGFVLPAAEIPVTFDSSRPVSPALTPSSYMETLVPKMSPTGFPATPTPVPNGSGLYLDKVVELEDAYLLVGNFTDAGDLPGIALRAQTIVPYEFRVTDRQGNPVHLFYRPDLMPPTGRSNITRWALEIFKPVDTPITITLPEVPVSNVDIFQFQVNTGANPAVGQTWSLNQSVDVGGYSFLVESVSLTKAGYTMKLRSPLSSEWAFFNLRLEGHNVPQLYEHVYDRKDYYEVEETLPLAGDLPNGMLTFTLQIFVDRPVGPWTLVWSPPSNP